MPDAARRDDATLSPRNDCHGSWRDGFAPLSIVMSNTTPDSESGQEMMILDSVAVATISRR
jgi:hypothetical protein